MSDIDSLVGLLNELFSIEEDFKFNETLQRKGLSMMLDNRRDRCIMVACSGRDVIGMCSAQMVVSTAEGGIAALIEDMVVTRSYRGRGVGGDLLCSIENWAHKMGAKRMQLLADKNNLAALQFYKDKQWATTRMICLRKK